MSYLTKRMADLSAENNELKDKVTELERRIVKAGMPINEGDMTMMQSETIRRLNDRLREMEYALFFDNRENFTNK